MADPIVFAGTAIAATISVISKACTVLWSLRALPAALKPFSNVRQKTIDKGPSSTTSR